ncbi:MAG: hypothetical protein ABJC09_03600 [Terriglobia bacterium]
MLVFFARVILFVIAISALRSVVNFVQRFWSGVQEPRSVARSANSPAAPTTLQQDPVCGTYVAVDSSLKKIVGGRVMHFCSPECRERYLA